MTAIRPCIISSGEVAGRRADRGGRSERRRQVDAVQGHRRRAQAARRADRPRRLSAARHRLSAAGRRDRPQLPDQCLRHGGDGAVAPQAGLFGGIGRGRATAIETRDRGRRPHRLRAARDRHAVGRPDAAHAVRAAAAAGCARRSCSTSRSTRSTPRPRPICSTWCGAGTARSAPCSPRCTISIWCRRISRRRCCWRASRWPGARPPTC